MLEKVVKDMYHISFLIKFVSMTQEEVSLVSGGVGLHLEFTADRPEPDPDGCDPGDGGPGVGAGGEDVHQGVGHADQPAQDVAEDVTGGELLCSGVNLHDNGCGNGADQEHNQNDANHHCDFPFLSLSQPLSSSHHHLQPPHSWSLCAAAPTACSDNLTVSAALSYLSLRLNTRLSTHHSFQLQC